MGRKGEAREIYESLLGRSMTGELRADKTTTEGIVDFDDTESRKTSKGDARKRRRRQAQKSKKTRNELISPRSGFEKTTLSNQDRHKRMNKEI